MCFKMQRYDCFPNWQNFLSFFLVEIGYSKIREGTSSKVPSGFRKRGKDSNRRPPGYEPDELPLLYPALSYFFPRFSSFEIGCKGTNFSPIDQIFLENIFLLLDYSFVADGFCGAYLHGEQA